MKTMREVGIEYFCKFIIKLSQLQVLLMSLFILAIVLFSKKGLILVIVYSPVYKIFSIFDIAFLD